ncbi:MAG: hypothetical protein IPH76_08595 [Xanthomonadales bacterium]|nr:hypothetical protein [Xanthomonadales bacterium]
MNGTQVFIAAGWSLRACSLALGLLASCLCVANAFAATPENGLYWDPGRPAQAYAIEHQGDRVALVMLSYDEAGRAEWFTASGPLQSGMLIGTHGHDPGDASYITGSLFRLAGGPPIGFSGLLPGDDVPYFTSAPVGQITAEFYGDGRVILLLRHNGQSVFSLLQRFNFGYGGFGRHDYLPHVNCWPNLAGEWVFVDREDVSRPARRFKLAQPQVRAWTQDLVPTSELRCDFHDQTQELLYADELSNAVLRCRRTREDSGGVGIDPWTFGCALVEAGETVFSFEANYTQLDRIRAWRGSLRDVGERSITDPHGPEMTGFRVR